MYFIIFKPNSCDSNDSPWCFPSSAIRHSANPIKPIAKVPCLFILLNLSAGFNFSLSNQFPCPTKKGKLYTLLSVWNSYLSNKISFAFSILLSNSSKKAFKSVVSFLIFPNLSPSLGKLIVTVDKFPLPTDVGLDLSITFSYTLIEFPI